MTDELQLLKEQAVSLGIKFHHRAGEKKLQSLIDEHLAKGNAPIESNVISIKDIPAVVPTSAEEFKKKQQEENKKRVAALIRVRIQCMNPQKKNWQGEFISVGSAKLGTFKRFVPFNGVEWHIPKIMYDMMKERKCTTFVNNTDDRGNRTKVGRSIDEFAIEVLEPLTKDEMEELARTQAARAGQG